MKEEEGEKGGSGSMEGVGEKRRRGKGRGRGWGKGEGEEGIDMQVYMTIHCMWWDVIVHFTVL